MMSNASAAEEELDPEKQQIFSAILPFITLEEGEVVKINPKTATANVKQLLATAREEADLGARVDELESFEPLQRDHSKCLDPRSCIGYGNAASDFDNEKQIRLAELKQKETK